MEYFGIFAFIMVCVLMSRVSRLERLLRENGILSLIHISEPTRR